MKSQRFPRVTIPRHFLKPPADPTVVFEGIVMKSSLRDAILRERNVIHQAAKSEWRHAAAQAVLERERTTEQVTSFLSGSDHESNTITAKKGETFVLQDWHGKETCLEILDVDETEDGSSMVSYTVRSVLSLDEIKDKADLWFQDNSTALGYGEES